MITTVQGSRFPSDAFKLSVEHSSMWWHTSVAGRWGQKQWCFIAHVVSGEIEKKKGGEKTSSKFSHDCNAVVAPPTRLPPTHSACPYSCQSVAGVKKCVHAFKKKRQKKSSMCVLKLNAKLYDCTPRLLWSFILFFYLLCRKVKSFHLTPQEQTSKTNNLLTVFMSEHTQ